MEVDLAQKTTATAVIYVCWLQEEEGSALVHKALRWVQMDWLVTMVN